MTTRPTPPHRQVAAALEDWWLTTDPCAPFDYDQVAEHVDQHLTGAGYRITPDTRTAPMHTTPPPPASTAFDAFLTLACVIAALIAAVQHDWWWFWAGGLGACVLGHELLLDIAAHRHRRGSRT